MQDPTMTPEDMYQEMVEQEMADIFLDDGNLVVEDVTMNDISFDTDY
jgi:hypothetical protein